MGLGSLVDRKGVWRGSEYSMPTAGRVTCLSTDTMALQRPPAASSSICDPFELEHLAEDATQPTHDLPLYTPLSHDNPFFTAEIFDVEKFLLSRSHISLPDLRSELRDYQAELKEELVKLINDDYEAFISLSTDLRGEGVRLERLKYPLRDLISQVQVSRVSYIIFVLSQFVDSGIGIKA